jgi:hypothetical protein
VAACIRQGSKGPSTMETSACAMAVDDTAADILPRWD